MTQTILKGRAYAVPAAVSSSNRNSLFSAFRSFALMLVALCGMAMLHAPLAMAADDHPAQQLVETAVNNLVADLKVHKDKIASNPGLLDSSLKTNIIPHLDFTSMTRLSVGKSWKKASKNQQETLVSEFETFLVNTYRSALSEYGGEQIEFLPYKKNKRDDRAQVNSLFKYGSNEAKVTYKLHSRSGPWMVYDIVVSDLSLVLQYKSSFSSEIERNGIDGLIKLLKDKNNS